MRMLGFFALFPATMMLTVSFFVLVVREKTDKANIKSFGKVVAVLLWICAAVVLSAGLYTVATGRCPVMSRMCGMKHMMGKGQCMMQGMESGCCMMDKDGKCVMPEGKMDLGKCLMKEDMHKGMKK